MLFSKVVWRGRLGMAAAKSAVSTEKESVSDKREFFRICDSKVQWRVFAIVLQLPKLYSIYKLLFNWVNSCVYIAFIIRKEPSAVTANGCFLY